MRKPREFPSDTNFGQYSRRTLRQGSTTTVANNQVSEQVVNRVNRWREDSNSRGRDPTTGLTISEVYTAVRSSVDAAPVYSLSHYHFPGGFYGWHTLSWRQQLHASLIIVKELETRGPSAVGATEYTLAEVSETDYTILGSCGSL